MHRVHSKQARSLTITSTGSGVFRIFEIVEGSRVAFHSLQLHHAWNVHGGAVLNDGQLIAHNLHCNDNKAGYGGCIYNTGSLVIKGALIKDNKGIVCGGGLYLLKTGADLPRADNTIP